MDYKDLQKIQKESTEQILPQQKKVLSASDKIRRKTSNLPDPTHPPMGWQDNKGYDHIFPWIHLPLDSKEFRQRVLQRYPDASDAEFFLRFSKAPAIGDIKVKKIKDLEYEFETIDAFSINEDGWLVNCQWDFDYQEGHFSADKNYVLSREKMKDKKKGEQFKAILKANHIFEKSGEYIIACKVQDNLAGETIFSKKIKI